MVHAEDKALFMRSIALSAQTLQGWQQEYRIITPSGKTKWLQGHSQPKRLANGDIVWDGFLTDVSDRKQAEAALEYQSNLLRTVIDSSPDWIFVKDCNFRYLLANQTLAAAVGFSPEEIVGKDDLEIGLSPEEIFGNPEKGIVGFRVDDQNALAGEAVFNPGEPVTSADGSFTWVETQKLPLRDRQGQIFGVLGVCRDITQRKRAEAALRESEQNLRTIFNNVHNGFFIHDLDGTILDVNQKVLEMHGVTYEQALKMSIADYGSTDNSLEQLSGVLRKAVAGEVQQIEWKGKRQNGTLFDAEVTVQKLTLGNRPVILTSLQDVSDRKCAEIALRQSQEMLQLVIDTLPQIIGWKDRNSIFMGCNKSIARIAGFDSPADMVGKSDYEMPWTPEETAWYLECDRRIMESGVAELHIIEQQTQADGTVVWLDTNKIPLRDVDGNVIGILFAIEDISDRKRLEDERAQAEVALRYSEQRFRDVTEAAGEYIWELDTAGCYSFVSDRVKAVKGYEPAELIGRSLFECLVAEDVDRTQIILQDAVKNRSSFKLECRSVIPSGEVIWEEVSGIPLVNSNGEIIGFRGTGLSITDRKHAEAALRQSEQNLRTIFNSVQNGFFLHEADGNIIDVNQKMLEMYGVTYEQALDLSIAKDYSSPDNSLEQIPLLWERALAGETQRFEWIARRPIDGSVFDAEVVLQKLMLSAQPVILASIQDISDRKRTEAALKQSEERLQLALEGSGDGLWDWDMVAGTTYFSSRWFTMLDYEVGELPCSYATWEMLIHPEDKPAVFNTLQAHIDRDLPYALEFRMRSKSGDWQWIGGYGKVVARDDAGQPLRMAGTHKDISDRKQVEEALRQQQIQLQTILDAVPSSIWLKDTQNHVLRANAAAAEVVGRSVDQVEGRSICELLPQGAETHYLDDLEVICSGRPKLGMIEPQYLPSGERRWLRTDKVPYRNSAGEIVGLVAVATDITDRKRAEIALRESEQQLREQAQRERLLNQLTQQIRNSLDFDIALSTALTEIQAILGVDRCQFAWYYSNTEEPYWEVIQEVCHSGLPDLTGCYPASMVGVLVNKLLQLEMLCVADVETVDDPVWKAFVQSLQMRSVLIIPMQMPSGAIGVICCSHSSKSHPWETDEIELLEAVMGQLAVALNQAELYAQSRAKAHELEQTLHQLQRTQAQMLQSEKMSSLGQLVAGVAHEINNPVNFIYGNLSYASDYIEDLLGLVKLYQQQYPEPVVAVEAQAEAIDLDFLIADLPKLLNSMKVGASRIQKIVASLRTFSRMDEAEVKSVNIHEGIDSTLLILQHRLKKRDDQTTIEIIKNYEDLPLIECYAGQLNQVFMNLLSNAIDALEDALKAKSELIPAITIETKRIDQFVTIEITDNGLGIPESVQQRLFDPFFTTKPLGKGTGMGLSISYQIVVEKHNGSIDCTSSEAGTTFHRSNSCLPNEQVNQPFRSRPNC
ncbi:MAG: PAS domain S-box protein [Leptolyngbyaceae cyanobacterium SM1_3_5]|nr:PAS domain S-box protein [Leptolyngbyaceae cyanobacterium SM1_3_5]